MIEPFKRVVRRHWPRLRLRTILLLTFVFVAALPGVGALFLRVYENALIRQTEAELVAQGAALAAAGAVAWPDGSSGAVAMDDVLEASSIDLRMTNILPERPPPRRTDIPGDPGVLAWAARLRPVLGLTAHTTLASILLLDGQGRVLVGASAGSNYGHIPEVRSARAGRAMTTLRRNDSYGAYRAFDWLSRASDLRIHHARPIVVGGRVVGILLLSRAPRALFVGIYADGGKIAFGVAAILATLIVLSGLLSRGIVRPVEALGAATRAVATGAGGALPAVPTTAAVEIQALYRDFATMAEAIDRRSRYLRDFAHAVSHEFKTPLAGIGGAVELLQDHPDMAAADRENFLANMAADVVRLTRLVSRLLDLARADMTEPEEGASTDLASAIRRVADAYGGGGFSLTLDIPPSLPHVALPSAVVETVVATLADNSRQAGASLLHVMARPADRIVRLSVRDDGPGIAVADRHRVFEPFFTSRRTSGGTGLGLPISRSLLHAYRGSIEMDERKDVGVGFVVLMPQDVPNP